MVGIHELHEHSLVQSMAEVLLLPIGNGRGRELSPFINSGIIVTDGYAFRRREAVGEEMDTAENISELERILKEDDLSQFADELQKVPKWIVKNDHWAAKLAVKYLRLLPCKCSGQLFRKCPCR